MFGIISVLLRSYVSPITLPNRLEACALFYAMPVLCSQANKANALYFQSSSVSLLIAELIASHFFITALRQLLGLYFLESLRAKDRLRHRSRSTPVLPFSPMFARMNEN